MLRKEYGLNAKFDISEEWFSIVLPRTVHVTTQTTTQRTTQTNPQKILEAIKQNPKISRVELAGIIGISEDGIKFHLTALKKSKAIRRVGPDFGGHWEIIKTK